MENPEGVLNLLDEFAKVKSKEIPNDLEEYLLYVAASGDPVYQWSLIKSLYRQKLINVITEFYETCPMIDVPACPNVDPFNYETMKNSLLERLDSFASAPFTIQRISELLTTPRKQYNRVDKFMRAIEKNIWVVSTREPGQREQGTPQEASGNLVNGVAPRVQVTVKHPKRGKSIEERIKSGHPQLIDDDEEDEEDESMESKANAELLANNDTEDTPLQCTSVKDLIEKYENGTIFCGTEEKSVQLEESSGDGSGAAAAAREARDVESDSESKQSDEDVNIEKLVGSPKIELVESSEGEAKDSKEPEDAAVPLVEVAKEDDEKCREAVPSESCPPESSDYACELPKPDTTDGTEERTTNDDADTVTVMEVLGFESEPNQNDVEPILEEPDSVKDEANEAEVKVGTTNEAEAVGDGISEGKDRTVVVEEEEGPVVASASPDVQSKGCPEKDPETSAGVVVELEPDSSSPDVGGAVVDVPILSETIDFIVKEAELDEGGKVDGTAAESSEAAKVKELIEETCTTSTGFDVFNKGSEFAGLEEDLCLQPELLETKMEETEAEEKSSEMIVEEGSDKMDDMEVDESITSSPMLEEEVMEPMDDSDANHS